MASQTDIANLALVKLGAQRLSDLDTTTERGETILDIWDMVRDDELRARVWRFAVARKTLAADATAPDWGFTSQYTLPGDCLRVIQVGEAWVYGSTPDSLATGETAPYLIEADKIVTDLAGGQSLKIRYVTRQTDVGLWDASFAHAFSCRLAMELCERLTEANSKAEKASVWYRDAITKAARANAIEHPPRRRAESSWIMARYGV